MPSKLKAISLLKESSQFELPLSEDPVFQRQFRSIMMKFAQIVNGSIETDIFRSIARHPNCGYIDLLHNLRKIGIDINDSKVKTVISKARLFTFKERRIWMKKWMKSHTLAGDSLHKRAKKALKRVKRVEKEILRKIEKSFPISCGIITRQLQKIKIGVTESEVAKIMRNKGILTL